MLIKGPPFGWKVAWKEYRNVTVIIVIACVGVIVLSAALEIAVFNGMFLFDKEKPMSDQKPEHESAVPSLCYENKPIHIKGAHSQEHMILAFKAVQDYTARGGRSHQGETTGAMGGRHN